MDNKRLAAHHRTEPLEAPAGFIEKFLEQVEKSPSSEAVVLIPSGETFTYAEILKMSEQIKSGLHSMGVGRGDSVVVMIPNSPQFLASILALSSLGALAVLLSERLTDFELRPRIQDSKPCGAIVIDEDLPLPFYESKSLRFALTLRPPSCETIGNGVRIRALVSVREGRLPLLPPPGNPRSFCHFTYKDFGFPVGAVHRYQDYSWVIQGLTDRFKIASETNHLLALPMYPVFGLLASVLALSLGRKLIVATAIKNLSLYQTIAQNRVGFMGLVPILIEKLLAEAYHHQNLGKNPKSDFVKGTEIVSAGSFLQPQLSQKFESVFGFAPYQGFGSSETLPLLTCYRGNNPLDCVGVPLRREFQVSILDIDGNPLEDGKIGQIAIGSPTLFTEYINRPTETKQLFRGNKILTGDLGYKNSFNQLFFIGRHLRFTKIASQMTDIAEVETVLLKHPHVERTTATTRFDPDRGKYVSAEITTKPGTALTPRELTIHCRKYLSPFKIPRQLSVTPRQRQYCLSNPKTSWEGM